MTLPDLKSTAQLDTAPWSKGVDTILKDLRSVQDLAKKLGTVKITADLSAGRDAQRATAAVRAALDNMVPSDMQRRIDGMFGSINTNAARSASVFEEQGSRVALLRARINELSNAVRLTRAEFQSGLGEASPQEIAELSARMGTLRTQLDAVGQEAKETFGEWSNEALKASMATRTAVQTVEAANGRISRLGLASQVKLGASAALAEFGPMAGGAANGLIQLARSSEQARLSSGFFEKQIQKQNIQVSQARQEVDMLAGAFNVMPNVVENTFKVLLRNGYTLQQASETMKLYAASALAANQDVGGAYNALADDVQRGTTIMSNSYGITANQATAWNQYAQSIGTTTDKLTAAQKAEGFLVQLRRESTQELEDADTILKGYAGSYGQMNLELQRSGQELGQNIMPLLTNGTRALVGLLDAFNALPAPVRNTITVLGVAAVAVGVLAIPVGGLASAYTALTTAKAANVAMTTVETAATTRLNVVTTIKNVLLMDTAKAYAIANTWAMRHNGSMAASVAVNNSVSASLVTLKGAIAGVAGAISIYTVAATAALALGLYWADSVKKTTGIYEQMDAANQASFERTMARVQELRRSGTELGRAQARYLLLNQQLQDAQQGELKGVNWLTGERIYGPPDEARIKKLQADLATTRQNITLLYTEAQRRGVLNLKLTEDQTKAVKELNKVLEGRQFDLKVTGLTDMQRDLATLGRDFEKIRQDFKKPFVVNGKLLDPAQTPALRDGLSQLDAQLLAEQQATRKRYADQAVKTAREAALGAQAAEIESMKEGAAKRAAQRQAEVEEIRTSTAEKVKALADFPTQAKAVEEAARKNIAAKRRAWAAEDVQLARENAKRVTDAEKSARDARIGAMAEGLRKEEALRAAAVADLKASIREQVAALEGDPRAQARAQGAGNAQVSALLAQQARQREEAVKSANQQVLDSEKTTRDAVIAGMTEGAAKEEAIRAAALADLRADVQKRVEALKDYPAQQARVQAEGNRQLQALETQQQAARIKAAQEAGKLVSEASRAARDAEISAIQDETQRTRAQREREVQDVRDSVKKRVEALRDYPKLQAQVIAEGQRQISAMEARYRQEDEQKAREHALKMAQAWAGVREAQFSAAQAGRGAGDAEFELLLSRRLAAARGNAVELARIEQEGQQERARRAQANADAQFAEEKRRLLETATLAVQGDKVTEGEKRTIWAKYYADLSKLDSDYQAGNRSRLKDSEEAARQAAEAMRLARIAEANKPVQQSENRQQELQWARDLSVSDAEILRINQEISAERAKQIQALQGQLDGVNGVKLTVEERRQVEGQIKQLQHDQAVTLKEQEGTQRALRQSALDRLDAEAQYAEKVARTSAELEAARRSQLAVMQARVRELDGQIAGEGREQERNALIGQRYGLLGQILDLTSKINDAPLDNEKRKLDLYKAQAETQLIASGLQNNEVEKARLTLQIAAQELLIANQRVATAQGQLAMEAALSEQAQARLAFAQAYAALLGQEMPMPGGGTVAQARSEAERNRERQESLKRQRDLESELLDVAEARARALQVIRGEGENAVQNAELELQFTRERLALVTRQLDEDGTDAANRVPLLRERLTLLQQEVEQERRVTEARRAAADLADELVQAESALTAALAGGQLAAEVEATRRLAQARQALTRAEEAYARARSEGDPGKIKDATEKLTSAIQAQRSAVAGLADVYRQQIAGMDSVREASERLKQAAYGEEGPVFNAGRERQRLDAISQRRNAAQIALAEALKGGDTGLIQKATEELARQQERVNKQIEYLNKNGQKVTDAGQRRTQVLSDQVDLLGISYDREAVNLAERAQIVDQESQNAMTLSAAATSFADATESLKRLDLAKQVEGIATELTAALKQAKLDADREALASRLTGGGGGSTGTAPQAMRFDPANINQLAQQFAGKLPTLGKIEGAVQAGTQSALENLKPGLVTLPGITPTTQPAPQLTVHNNFYATINAASDRAPDIKRAAREAFQDFVSEARQKKAWEVNPCK